MKSFALFFFVSTIFVCIRGGENSERHDMSDWEPNYVLDWGYLQLDLYSTPTFTTLPPMIAFNLKTRMQSVVHSCAYDAWSLWNRHAKAWVATTLPKVSPRRPEDRKIAINYAMYRCLKHEFRLFSSFFGATIDAFFDSKGYNVSYVDATNLLNPASIGNLVALIVTNHTDTDGTNADGMEPSGLGTIYSDYTGYYPVNDPMPQVGKTNCSQLRSISKWQPARVAVPGSPGVSAVQVWSGAQFGSYRPFSMVSTEDLRPPAPPFNHSLNYLEFQQIYNAVVSFQPNLTDYFKAHAEYVQSPVTSSFYKLALDAAKVANLTIDDTVKYLFAEQHAQMDATCAHWAAKRYYDLARPTTVIQCLNAGTQILAWKGPYQGVGLINGADWRAFVPSFVVNNPSPEYPCGHCTMTEATCETSRLFFGYDTFLGYDAIFPAGSSQVEGKIADPNAAGYIQGVTDVPNSGPQSVGYSPATNITLHWNTWTEVSELWSISRVYLGVHTPLSRQEGINFGKAIAQKVFQKAQALWSGADECL